MRALLRQVPNRLGRAFPALLWRRHDAAARRLGLDRLHLALSFDCDTPEDARAALEVHGRLDALGVPSSWAVPGTELERDAAVYAELARRGARFLNHGWRPHAERFGDGYRSVTFYAELTPEEVAGDVARGHEAVARVAARPPTGFRAPHFGLFQRTAQLRLLYAALEPLGYRFSTSTMPALGLRGGPLVRRGRLWEVPLSGSVRYPCEVLDTWGHRTADQPPRLAESYAALAAETVDRLLRLGVAGVLNWYADPGIAVRGEAFFRAVGHALSRGVVPIGYEELLARAEGRPGGGRG